jgi:hypothetical protein
LFFSGGNHYSFNICSDHFFVKLKAVNTYTDEVHGWLTIPTLIRVPSCSFIVWKP